MYTTNCQWSIINFVASFLKSFVIECGGEWGYEIKKDVNTDL